MIPETLTAVAEQATHPVSNATTLLFTGLLVLMILSLALEEKIHAKKSLIVGVLPLSPFLRVVSCIFCLSAT